ncbi:MAG: polysaccharide deacetylase family protein [Clostridia bacterium]|nr:polysaccharide deacetylase family protein [Clostridia bacterium]
MSEDNRYIFDNDIDKRMEEALNDERERLNAREHARRTKRNHRKMILAGIVLLIAVFSVIGLVKAFSSNDYSSEEEFTAFADKALTENQICTPDSDAATEYSYDKDFSTAIRTDTLKNDEINGFRERKIYSILESADREEAKNLIIDTESFRTGNGAVSMYIHHYQYRKDGRNLVMCSSHADTYLFKEDTGEIIEPLQVLNVNYKDKAEEYASEYMTKTFNDRERSENYEDFITSTDKNYNEFVMTGDDIIFLFDPGTVVTNEENVIEMPMAYMLIDTAIRPETLDRYIDSSKPMVALTYDDGPGGDSESRILQCLSDNGSVATFFYQGYRLSSFSENARKAVKVGCEIGNHSWDHPVMSKLSKKQIISQIKKTNSKIEEICGVEPVVARPPYGDFNKNVLESCGIAEVLWTVDTKDWDTRDAKMTFDAVKRQKNLDGKIILMHSIYDETAEATEMIVPWLKEQGIQTVTVSELIKYKTGTTPKPGKLYRKLQ